MSETENDNADLTTGSWKQRTEDLSWREMDDQAIVLDLRTASYLRLNGSGLALWERLETAASLADLADFLVERFELSIDIATTDATSFLRAALAAGLLEAAH